jgi:hypothetical protein
MENEPLLNVEEEIINEEDNDPYKNICVSCEG